MTDLDRATAWELTSGDTSERGALKAADERLLVQLFDELRFALLRYLRTLNLEAQDAEEVIQEAFLALFGHLRRGRSRENLRGWIFRVAHNVGLKRRWRSAREAKNAAIDDLAATRADGSENPEEQLLSNQRFARLQAVLRALPEQDQYCLALRAEGLRYREIAEVLGISLGSVSASLARSLARLGQVDATRV